LVNVGVNWLDAQLGTVAEIKPQEHKTVDDAEYESGNLQKAFPSRRYWGCHDVFRLR